MARPCKCTNWKRYVTVARETDILFEVGVLRLASARKLHRASTDGHWSTGPIKRAHFRGAKGDYISNMSDRPGHNPSSFDIDIARRIDAICRQFEADWRGGRRPRVEDYPDDGLGNEIRPALLAELEALERELRQSEETMPRLRGRRRDNTSGDHAPLHGCRRGNRRARHRSDRSHKGSIGTRSRPLLRRLRDRA